jgi:predicted DNA-binding protein (MmcQ/YjbR family)
MNVDDIRAYCLSFPNATENLQWGDDLCFKIRGKIFTIVNLDDPKMCFKCTADKFAELIEMEDIHPAPYVGRYKWVMLDRLDALRTDELKDMIRQSYEMVASKAPKVKARKSKRKNKGRKKTTSRRRI